MNKDCQSAIEYATYFCDHIESRVDGYFWGTIDGYMGEWDTNVEVYQHGEDVMLTVSKGNTKVEHILGVDITQKEFNYVAGEIFEFLERI